MAKSKTTLQEWRHAYSLAGEVYDLAPWTWMYDSAYIGFTDPEDGAPRFINVMGRLGEHLAVAVYRRTEDLFRMIDLAQDPAPSSDTMLETSQLQLSFEDRDFLAPEDRLQDTGVLSRIAAPYLAEAPLGQSAVLRAYRELAHRSLPNLPHPRRPRRADFVEPAVAVHQPGALTPDTAQDVRHKGGNRR